MDRVVRSTRLPARPWTRGTATKHLSSHLRARLRPQGQFLPHRSRPRLFRPSNGSAPDRSSPSSPPAGVAVIPPATSPRVRRRLVAGGFGAPRRRPFRRRQIPIVAMLRAGAAGGMIGTPLAGSAPASTRGPRRTGKRVIWIRQYVFQTRWRTSSGARPPQADVYFKPSKRFLYTDGQASRRLRQALPGNCQWTDTGVVTH